MLSRVAPVGCLRLSRRFEAALTHAERVYRKFWAREDTPVAEDWQHHLGPQTYLFDLVACTRLFYGTE